MSYEHMLINFYKSAFCELLWKRDNILSTNA